MDTYLHRRFHFNLKNLFRQKLYDCILIAVSGGQDSLCLIKLIEDFAKQYRPSLTFNIEYIYIDHQWKKDSKEQIKHLINLIKINKRKISIYQMHNIIKSEIKARQSRYKIIINHALLNKYSIIMTAHTKTDRIETFWQQLIRGTSIDGATSLISCRQLNKKIELWRPLINFNRIEINWFCRKFYLPIWSDITNYEYKINRNRLRNEFIPYLNKYFVANIEQKIGSFLDISEIDNEYIKQNAIKLYLISRHKLNIALNYSLIKKQHLALQTRTLQIFFYHNFNKSLNINLIKKLIQEILNMSFVKMQWGHLNIQMCNNWLYIY